jgi:hypothetical protein
MDILSEAIQRIANQRGMRMANNALGWNASPHCKTEVDATGRIQVQCRESRPLVQKKASKLLPLDLRGHSERKRDLQQRGHASVPEQWPTWSEDGAEPLAAIDKILPGTAKHISLVKDQIGHGIGVFLQA